ncbi:hypothetical protein H5410_040373 [Solanum commersonii]|uniref:Uncharacterized protein n=1 Tax=Solanum commersonii TaxID=4109 RepID=A0A9J5XNP1_SOLCO|nr:hypothetical protein H5410_040373 [Solanum commersonii]
MKETKPIFLTSKISPIIFSTTKSVTAFKEIGFSNDSTVPKFKIAAFAEFLSHEIKVSSIPFRSEYFRSRYATLLWKYDTDKVNAGYVNKNDDPIRLNVASILLADDELINVE